MSRSMASKPRHFCAFAALYAMPRYVQSQLESFYHGFLTVRLYRQSRHDEARLV